MTNYCAAQVTIGDETLYCDALATKRVAGEQDSFGTEWLWFCEGCYVIEMDEWAAERRAEAERRKVGLCHGEDRTDLVPTSVFNDHSWEPLVYACPECIKSARRALDEEMAYLDRMLTRRY